MKSQTKTNPTPSLHIPSSIQQTLTMVLEHEARALLTAAHALPENAVTLVNELFSVRGRIVFSGMGKSGIIGKKLAATFSSLGKPSFFLHPSEALHGDIGMIMPDDYLIALSKSGTGSELKTIIAWLHNHGNKTALISCRNGELTQHVHLSVILPFQEEACTLNLAPTSSSTLMLAFGDALAVAISQINGFTKNDFAHRHPAGALGKRLLLDVASFMHQGNQLPLVFLNTSFTDLISAMTSKKLGVAIVTNKDQKLLGIITDGDLRRAFKHGKKLFDLTAQDIMIKNPKTIAKHSLAYDALTVMETNKITCLVVTQNDMIRGIIHLHDLVEAGIKS